MLYRNGKILLLEGWDINTEVIYVHLCSCVWRYGKEVCTVLYVCVVLYNNDASTSAGVCFL